MIERLTKRIKDCVYYTKGQYEETLSAECTPSDVRNILNRLAEYEDAGIEPQNIKSLTKLLCAYGELFANFLHPSQIQELIELDKKIKSSNEFELGDTVYCIMSNGEIKETVIDTKFMGMNGYVSYSAVIPTNEPDRHEYLKFEKYEIGRTVFKDQKSAELAGGWIKDKEGK